MSSLKPIEKKYLTDLLESQAGYVLDFTNPTFEEFFRSTVSINIYSDRYCRYGNSKMKRLLAFWEIETDATVGKALHSLLEVWVYDQHKKELATNTPHYIECVRIVNRLLGKKVEPKPRTEEDFLSREFKLLNLTKLNLDLPFETVIKQRIDEIQRSLKSGASLAVIFLCGSTLEGFLGDVASKRAREFNLAKSAPKDKNKKVKRIHEWSLANLIDVAHEIGVIEPDIKKYGHALRDFRNYIHPRQQAMEQFNPDKHTAEISWKVLQATIASLSGER